jgi:hypothetical protein
MYYIVHRDSLLAAHYSRELENLVVDDFGGMSQKQRNMLRLVSVPGFLIALLKTETTRYNNKKVRFRHKKQGNLQRKTYRRSFIHWAGCDKYLYYSIHRASLF